MSRSGTRWRALSILLLVGCGRIGFQGASDGDAGPGAPEVDAGEVDAGEVDAGASPLDAGVVVPERVRVGGDDVFILGGNLPWHDFGADFGDGNLSTQVAELDPAFTRASDGGLRAVRWLMWAFPPGTGQLPLERDGGGRVTGFNAATYDDLDTATDLAEAHDLYLSLVLFKEAPIPGLDLDVADSRAALTDAIVALVTHADMSARVLTWSVWFDADTNSHPGARTFVEGLIAALAFSPSLFAVTVSNIEDAVWACGAGADYVGLRPFDKPVFETGTVNDLATDEGIACPKVFDVVFVTPGGDAPGVLADIRDRGFAGLFAWSLDPDRTTDLNAIDYAATAAFSASFPEVGP